MKTFTEKKFPHLILGCALTSLVACTSTTTAPPTQNAKAKPEALFVIHSQNGKITQQNGQYQLTLTHPVISYFTDRPYRKAGHLTQQKYLSIWKVKYNDSFLSDPPNASLAGLNYLPDHPLDTNSADETNALLIIKTSTWDPAKKALVMQVSPLDTSKLSPGKLDDVTLFIDSGPIPDCDIC